MSHRLLLIEDSPTQLLTIKRTLESHGWNVIDAHSAVEAITKAHEFSPDLIISDIVMSGVNGYQLCRLIKNDPELGSIPVILLTKLDGSLDRFWGLKCGADKYIPKEPGFHELTKAVKEILSKKHPNKQIIRLSDNEYQISADDMNRRLNQLLERLLFEATISDEVRRIGDDILDLEVISEKLFALLSSILDCRAAFLLLNQGRQTKLLIQASDKDDEKAGYACATKLCMQMGLPPVLDAHAASCDSFEDVIVQPIDMAGIRIGLLVVIPPKGDTYKPNDVKVIKIISEQLAVVLRLYLSLAQRGGEPVPKA
jgi:CheY-like chemotaxis protein